MIHFIHQRAIAAGDSIQNTSFYKETVNFPFQIQPLSNKILDFVLPRNEITECREFRIIPLFFENWIGNVCFKWFLPHEKLCQDKELTLKVNEVFKRLIDVCPCKSIKWEVKVIKDATTVNAFCLPGGKVAITTGMINKLKEPIDFNKKNEHFKTLTFEDNLAAILGHEIVHAAAGHIAQTMLLKGLLFLVRKISVCVFSYLFFEEQNKDKNAGDEKASLIQEGNLNRLLVESITHISKRNNKKNVKNYKLFFGFCFKLFNYLLIKYDNRKHELESDKYGIEIAHQAGYNIYAAERIQLLFLSMENKKEGDEKTWLEKRQDFFSSHPSFQKRLIANRETIQRVLKSTIQIDINIL